MISSKEAIETKIFVLPALEPYRQILQLVYLEGASNALYQCDASDKVIEMMKAINKEIDDLLLKKDLPG